METKKIIMSFANIETDEKKAMFQYNGKKYTVVATVDPYSKNVICSLFLDKEPIVKSRIAVLGDPLIGTYGIQGFDNIDCEIMFLPDDISYRIGNLVDYKMLNNGVELHAINRGDYY